MGATPPLVMTRNVYSQPTQNKEDEPPTLTAFMHLRSMVQPGAPLFTYEPHSNSPVVSN